MKNTQDLKNDTKNEKVKDKPSHRVMSEEKFRKTFKILNETYKEMLKKVSKK